MRLTAGLELGDRMDILAEIKEAIGDQKIDLLVRRPGDPDPFVAEILKKALPLS